MLFFLSWLLLIVTKSQSEKARTDTNIPQWEIRFWTSCSSFFASCLGCFLFTRNGNWSGASLGTIWKRRHKLRKSTAGKGPLVKRSDTCSLVSMYLIPMPGSKARAKPHVVRPICGHNRCQPLATVALTTYVLTACRCQRHEICIHLISQTSIRT